jgi:hypothetical protein
MDRSLADSVVVIIITIALSNRPWHVKISYLASLWSRARAPRGPSPATFASSAASQGRGCRSESERFCLESVSGATLAAEEQHAVREETHGLDAILRCDVGRQFQSLEILQKFDFSQGASYGLDR